MSELTEEQIEAEAQALVQRVRAPAPRERRLATPLREVPLRWVSVRGRRIAAWRVGEGPAVLLAHGSADNHTVWSPLMQALIAAGRSFVTLDMPGQNHSEPTGTTLDDGAEALLAVAAALGPVDAAVGHSLGGAMTMRAISRGLPAQRAVIIATGLFTNWELWRLKPPTFPQDTPPAVLARAEALVSTPWATPGMDFDACATVRGFEIPGLFVHSPDDEYWSPEAARRMADAWPGATVWHPPGLSHRGVARDPDVCARIVEFLGPG